MGYCWKRVPYKNCSIEIINAAYNLILNENNRFINESCGTI